MTLLKDNNYKDINVALLSLEADIKNKISGFDTSVIDKQLAEINSRIDKINAGDNNTSDEIEDINYKLNSNSNKIKNIERNIEDIDTQIDGIEQKLSDIFSAENKVTDFNATTNSGIYYWLTDAANRPTDYGVLLVNKYDRGDNNSIWINQIAYGTNNKIYFRQNINSGNWTDWKAVAFEGELNALTVNGKTYDGSEAVDAGVQTVENGGTGVTTQADINKAFIGNLTVGNDNVTDGTEFVSSYASENGFADSSALNKPYKRQFIKVWNYIKDKISSVLGLTSAKVSSYDSHLTNKDNPHSVTKSQVGLGSVVNTGDSATPVNGGTTKFTTGGAYTELNKKVDKVDGKGLSSNDFTSTYKNKLDKIDTTVTASSSNLVTSGAVATAISTEVTNRNTAITNAINNLDVSSVGGDGKYISAISETDGKISATSTTMDTAPTANSVKAVTSGGIKTALDNKADVSNTNYKTTKVFYGKRDGRYVKIGSIPVSSGSVSYTALDIDVFSASPVANFPVGSINLNMSSGNYSTAFNINGYSSIPLNDSDNTIYPRIVVEKTSTDYILYVDSTYSYLSITVTEGHSSKYTRGNFEEVSTLSGTVVYDSTVDNQIIPVSGALPVANGGTGQTTANAAANAFINSLTTGESVPEDNDYFISQYVNGGTTNTAYYRRPVSKLWEYIKGKISSVLGLTENKLALQGSTVSSNSYTDTNPKIEFKNVDGSQNISLTFTDWDAVQAPASLTLNGNQGDEYFIAPNIKATTKFIGNLTGNVNGDVTGSSGSANKLTTARTAYVDLGTASTTRTIDWSGDTTIPVNGVLQVEHGGTGAATAESAANSLIASLASSQSVPVDSDYFISQVVNGGPFVPGYERRPISKLWEYIKGKISQEGEEFGYDHIVHDGDSLLEWANCTDGSMKKVLIKSGTYNITKVVDFSQAGTGYVLAEQGAVINSHVPIAFTAPSGKTVAYNLNVVCDGAANGDNSCAFSAGNPENLILYNCSATYRTYTEIVNRNLFVSCTCYNCSYAFQNLPANSSISMKVFYQCRCYNCKCLQTIEANSSTGIIFDSESYFYKECHCVSCDAELTTLRNIKSSTKTFTCYYNCWDRCIGCLSKINVNSKALTVYSTLYGFLRCQHMSSCKETHTEGYANIKGVVQCIYISSTSALSGESNTNVGNSCDI